MTKSHFWRVKNMLWLSDIIFLNTAKIEDYILAEKSAWDRIVILGTDDLEL